MRIRWLVSGAELALQAAMKISLPSFWPPPRVPDNVFDGAWIGAGGRTVPRSASSFEVAPLMPRSGKASGVTFFVNGIRTDVAKQAREAQAVADSTGMAVIAVHNATDGGMLDMAQVKLDKLYRLQSQLHDVFETAAGRLFPIPRRSAPPANPAAQTLARGILERLDAGQTVHVIGHSQGALITANALTYVKEQLVNERGLTRAQAEAVMARIEVESFCGAACTWPDGPRYVHYMNELDPAPVLLGIAGPIPDAGRGAVVRRFRDVGIGALTDLPPHTVATYLRNRSAFPA